MAHVYDHAVDAPDLFNNEGIESTLRRIHAIHLAKQIASVFPPEVADRMLDEAMPYLRGEAPLRAVGGWMA